MQLARFRRFLEEVLGDPDLKKNVRQIRAYRIFQGAWFDIEGAPVGDASLLDRLTHTHNLVQPWRARRSLEVFLPVAELDSVLVATFFLPPKLKTSKTALSRVQECLKHSNNAFDATHDALTGLLNQAELERLLKTLLAQASGPLGESDLTGSTLAARSVHVFALDVDHFKQCNDSYGHQFGNLVLQVLALRLEKSASEIKKERAELDPVVVARPHGEEFFLIAAGSIEKSELLQIGENIRLSIRDTPIPSDAEWQQLKSLYASELTLPHITDRRITVSVGITTLPVLPSIAEENDEEVIEAMNAALREADVALYKAKSGGRDTVRHYSDILQQYGTVLEHHPDTDVVAIDLGSGVGVLKGQEFLVFHPDFSGSKPFMFSDGRSKKRLGSYPKRPSGHIEVFDVQQEISFCRVVSRAHSGLFPPHSLLEAVPLGSISHLFSSDRSEANVQPELANAQQLREQAAALAVRSDGVLAAVFTIDNAQSVQKERGSAFVNQALARIYTAIAQKFGNQSAIGQIDSVTMAVVGKMFGSQTVADVSREVAQECTAAFGGRVKVVAGTFEGRPKKKEAADQKTDLTKALEFATYAVSPEARLQDVEPFTSLVASRIIAGSRTRRNYAKAVKDYYDLTAYGVESAYMENQVGLVAFDREDKDLVFAREHISKARDMNPTHGIFSANLGIIEYHSGNYAAAHEAFEAAAASKGFVWPDNYKAIRAHSAYSLYRSNFTAIEPKRVLSLLDEAVTVNTSLHHFVPSGAISKAKADPLLQLANAASAVAEALKR